MSWIESVWQPTQPIPDRILVAGCGTGAEAFLLRRRFPDAEMIAVDFSPRSIQLARGLQKKMLFGRPVHFLAGDLTARSFAKTVGRNFDFITCHGVLSYIPNPARALANLARVLAPHGALYLGVNGASHISIGWRRVLAADGFDLNRFEDGPRLRASLKLFDALAEHAPGQIARQDAEYLAGDLFGALNRALPLARWNGLARRAGLHCCGSLAALAALRPVLNGNFGGLLMPLSRGEVAERFDWLRPAPFHYLIFRREAPPAPPWGDAEALLAWRPQLTKLYRHRWPKRKAAGEGTPKVEFRSRSTNTLVEMRVPAWELAILQESDGKRSLRQIIAACLLNPPRKTLVSQLYLLHQFAILNLRPPI